MNELFKELEHELKQEQWQKLWQRVGSVMVRASVAVVALTIGWVLWQHHTQEKRQEATGRFLAAARQYEAGDYKEAAAAYAALAREAGGELAGLATLRAAEAQRQLGHPEKARALYAEQARREGGGAFGDLAAVLSLRAAVEAGDAQPPAVTLAKDSPYGAHAEEMKGWHALKTGKREEAAQIFRTLAQHENAAPTQRQRMSEVAAYLAPGGEKKE